MRVPTYTNRQQALRPGYRQGVNVQASPEAFGAGIGRGMTAIGQGLGQASDAMNQLAEFDARQEARDAQTALERDKMQLEYGPNGYMTLQGRNAVDGLEGYNQALEELKRTHGAGLSPTAARYYEDAATTTVTSGMRSGIIHSASGRKQWAQDSSTARLETIRDQALNTFNDPAAVNRSIAAGYVEIAQQAELMGWGADVVALKRQEFASGVHSSVALAMASQRNGATSAMSYIADHSDDIDPAVRLDLETKLRPFAVEEEALSVVGDIMGGTRGGAQAGTQRAATAGEQGPRNYRADLLNRAAAAGKDAGHIDGLEASFAQNLSAMFEDAPDGIRDGLQVGSGFRSVEHQQRLWDQALQKYGSEAEARKWVAPPGRSQHNHGNAVDIWYNGVRLDRAPERVRQWVHDNAAAYGLRFPMSWESWHIEPEGARGGATVVPSRDGVAARTTMPSYGEAMARINEITDPDVRAAAIKQLDAQFTARSKAESYAADAAKGQIWEMMLTGTQMSDIPLDLKIAAGREAVSGFETYEQSQGEITTDAVLYRDLLQMSAADPRGFASQDLTAPEIINNLSRSDFQDMAKRQASILGDERKAREEGLSLTTAFSQAETQLAAVGITTVGKQGRQRQEASERIARFQTALADEMAAFREANNGRQPTQLDIRDMTNRLLLPIVTTTERLLIDREEEGFLFEAGMRADGTTVDVVVEYGDIPIDLRRSIRRDLEQELGREVSDEEIVQRYEDFVLSR